MDNLIDTPEVAKRLGISAAAVRRLYQRGAIPHVGLPIAADTVGEFGSGRLARRIRFPGVLHIPHLPANRPSMGIRRQYQHRNRKLV